MRKQAGNWVGGRTALSCLQLRNTAVGNYLFLAINKKRSLRTTREKIQFGEGRGNSQGVFPQRLWIIKSGVGLVLITTYPCKEAFLTAGVCNRGQVMVS